MTEEIKEGEKTIEPKEETIVLSHDALPEKDKVTPETRQSIARLIFGGFVR